MNQGELMQKQRIRINVSTTAKGKAQFDVTVEAIDENPEFLRGLLAESLEIAKKTAIESGFELAG